ncbi:hypothetical protein VM1G_11264 [Cytospora mali]|uniref:Uncharacterized protein n=1 Tax=Cytospora mali TaxID=578113 RepID=A0A194VMZ5_CYTMA|nr:hypothetical protein VM1G_11264 [Valsa mali]
MATPHRTALMDSKIEVSYIVSPSSRPQFCRHKENTELGETVAVLIKWDEVRVAHEALMIV